MGVLVYNLAIVNTAQEQVVLTVLLCQGLAHTFLDGLHYYDLAVVQALLLKFVEEIVHKTA